MLNQSPKVNELPDEYMGLVAEGAFGKME